MFISIALFILNLVTLIVIIIKRDKINSKNSYVVACLCITGCLLVTSIGFTIMNNKLQTSATDSGHSLSSTIDSRHSKPSVYEQPTGRIKTAKQIVGFNTRTKQYTDLKTN